MLCVVWIQVIMYSYNLLTFVLLYLFSFFEGHREDKLYVNCVTLFKKSIYYYYWKLTCSRNDIAEKLLSWCDTTITHSWVTPHNFAPK